MTPLKTILFLMALSILSGFGAGCNHHDKQNAHQINSKPTFDEIDSVQKSNQVGQRIYSEDSFFTTLSKYKIVGFGHYHDKIDNFTAFQYYVPKLRKQGFLVLAVELPSSKQPLLDSIMKDDTPPEKTSELLKQLNTYLASGEVFIKTDTNYRHHLFNIILEWLNLGGRVVAIDVPYAANETSRKNEYFIEMMQNTIKEQSTDLYERVKLTDINQLDDKTDLIKIAEIRSAYMSAMLDYYSSLGVKTVCFLGVKHLLLKDNSDGQLGVSTIPISIKYFNTRIFSLYPYFTTGENQLYRGHNWIGDAAYSVKTR